MNKILNSKLLNNNLLKNINNIKHTKNIKKIKYSLKKYKSSPYGNTPCPYGSASHSG